MKRVISVSILVMALLSLTVLGGGLWLVKTEHGLRFVLNQVSDWYSNQPEQSLQLELEKGDIWQGMVFSTVAWQQGEKSAEIRALALRLSLGELLAGRLLIDEISARDVFVNTGPPDEDPEPLQLPDQVSLPLDIELLRLHVGSLNINQAQLKNITARAAVNNQQLSLYQLNAEFQQVGLAAAANLILRKPYPLAGVLKAAGEREQLAVEARLDLKGSLENLQLALLAHGSDLNDSKRSQSLKADAVVMPFSTAMIEQLNLSATGFDPSAWLEGAPSALLNIDATVQPDEKFLHTRGTFQLSNSAPGTLPQGKIPVSDLAATFNLKLQQQQPEQFQFVVKEVLFSDGKRPAGRASAQLNWNAPKAASGDAEPVDLLQGTSRFAIQARGLNAALFAALEKPTDITATIEGKQQGQQIELTQLVVRDRQAVLTGRLNAVLDGKKPVDLALDFLKINPASYVPAASALLQGSLNGQLKFKGNLADNGQAGKGKAGGISPAGQLDLNLDDSRLANAPLKLLVSAHGSPQRVDRLLLDMNVVGNTAHAAGAYGTQSDFINFNASLGQLKKLGQILGLKLDGTAFAEGRVQFVDSGLSGQADVQVKQLKLDQLIEIESVTGNFSLGSASNSPWLGSVQVGKVRKPDTKPGTGSNLLNSANIKLDGTRSQHTLDARFISGLTTFSRNRPLQSDLQLQGGMLGKGKNNGGPALWKGVLSRLKVEGLWLPARSLELQKPAPLAVGPGLIELLGLQVKGEDGSLIDNRVLKVAGREIQIEGGMPRFFFPRLSPILRKPVSIEPNNLVARVDWRYKASPGFVDGHVNVTHVSGGLQVLEDSQIDVDIRQLQATLDFNRTGAQLAVNIVADKFGSMTANLDLPVAQNPDTKTWSLAGNKPMQGAIAASFTELNWLGPMVSEGVRTTGTGQVAMAVGGTLDKPDVQGRLFAMNLDVFQLDQGVRLEEGNVIVDFTLDRATIDTLDFTVYHRTAPRRQIEALGPLIQGKGKISASGQWNLTGLNGGVQVRLDKVPLLQRPDRWLIVDSSATIQQPVREGEALRIRGDVKALGAYFEMPEKGPQTLSEDVYILGRSEATVAGLPIDLQMQASLGELFYLNAAGLKTRLTGGLRLVMLEGVGGSGQRRPGRRLTANGTIQAVDGTYRAYGQDLTIDRGVVNFQGPLDNPGLNVRAVRKGVAVEAGVEVTGTAQRPKVTLVSDPAVPDSEKLSWMIIGRGSNSADRDSTLLLTAAAAIFGNEDESTTRKIARSVGIDDLNFSTGSLTAADTRAVGSKVAVAPGADNSATIIGSDDPLLSQRIISLGKRLSDQVYLSFDQSVTTAASIVKLNYQYSRQLSFIARAGADNAVDVLYQLSFD